MSRKHLKVTAYNAVTWGDRNDRQAIWVLIYAIINAFDPSYVDSIITSRIHNVGWEIDGPLLNLEVVITFSSA